jgi:hypothetical protein
MQQIILGTQVSLTHQIVEIKNTLMQKIYGGFRPMVSDNRPNSGWKAVDVNRNDVDNHEALFELSKYEVMTG